MKKIEIIQWQTSVVTDSTKIPNSVKYTVTLPDQEFNVTKALFKNYIEIRRKSYSNRENTQPIMFFDPKKHLFYNPSDLYTHRLNQKKLDYIYAEMKYDGHLLFQNQLLSFFSKKEKITFNDLSRHDRNQYLHYPSLFKFYLEYLYQQDLLTLPYNPVTNRFLTIDQLLYDTSFMSHFFSKEQMTYFIHWMNTTYNLKLNPDHCIYKIQRHF